MEARAHITSPIVDSHRTAPELVDKILTVVTETITLVGDNRPETVAHLVKRYLEQISLGEWQCHLVHDQLGFIGTNFTDSVVEIRMGRVGVTVHKAVDSVRVGL